MRVVSYNLAELFEVVADAVPEREAMVVGDRRRLTYRALDERATRLANHLREVGIGAGDHVGLQLFNGTEYIEGMLAAFKIRAVPINVNYRYVEKELAYLYDDADLRALLHHRSFAPRVAAVAHEVPTLRHFLHVVDDDSPEPVPGSVEYEAALDAASPDRDFPGRTSDDLYVAYTGGTTGMPKGVMWRSEDIFFGALGGGDIFQAGNFVDRPEDLADRIPEQGIATLTTPPFIHNSAHWGAFMGLYGGGTIVTTELGRFAPAEIWGLVTREKVNVVVLVGDAMAGPLLAEWERNRERYDCSSLIVIGSGGAVLSPRNKERLAAINDGLMVVDGMGSSELGTVGTLSASAGDEFTGPRFTVNEQTTVLDDDLRPVEPGSGHVGQLARTGHIPLGYYGDPEKTAATFVTDAAGTRWALAGDMATIDADGTVNLLGRGSVSINTGGEKVYPEEVEVAVRHHPDVVDVLVVGIPDPRWGQSVVAVIQPIEGASPSVDEIAAVCRQSLAGFKVPKAVCLVDSVERSPAGKGDYRWAQEHAARATTP